MSYPYQHGRQTTASKPVKVNPYSPPNRAERRAAASKARKAAKTRGTK